MNNDWATLYRVGLERAAGRRRKICIVDEALEAACGAFAAVKPREPGDRMPFLYDELMWLNDRGRSERAIYWADEQVRAKVADTRAALAAAIKERSCLEGKFWKQLLWFVPPLVPESRISVQLHMAADAFAVLQDRDEALAWKVYGLLSDMSKMTDEVADLPPEIKEALGKLNAACEKCMANIDDDPLYLRALVRDSVREERVSLPWWVEEYVEATDDNERNKVLVGVLKQNNANKRARTE